MIKAEIIADSLNSVNGRRATTFVITHQRFFHAEVLRHRVFEFSVASSRAIPTKKILRDVIKNPALPSRFGKKNKGMQDAGSLSNTRTFLARSVWNLARWPVVAATYSLEKIGVAKQITNRLVEPWVWITCVVTGTQWENFYRLRLHKDAQPEFQELAHKMLIEHAKSDPVVLNPGEYHIPFYNNKDERMIESATAKCARASYLNFHGKNDLDDDRRLYKILLSSRHLSPFGHTCRAEEKDEFNGNLRGFTPYRKLLDGGDSYDNDSLFDPRLLLEELA